MAYSSTHPSISVVFVYFMLPTLSPSPPWDSSSTPLPCSDSFWERWKLEQLQSSLIADGSQCPVPGQCMLKEAGGAVLLSHLTLLESEGCLLAQSCRNS